MKAKTKKFSRKLLATFLAVLMALTAFSVGFTAFGASEQGYVDDKVEYNKLAWAVLSDEQVATALLDYADGALAEFGPKIDLLLAQNLPTSGLYYYNLANRQIGLNAAGIIKETVNVYTHSVDEIFQTLESVQSLINSYGGFLGDAKNIHFESTKNVRRSNTSSCDIIRDVLGILQKNSADYNGNDIVGEFLRGGFDLGTIGSLANLDLYPLLGNMLGLPEGYQSNAVYNIAQYLLINNTQWFSEDEKSELRTYWNTSGTKTWVYDDILLDKLTTELIDKINVLVTYGTDDSSATRYEAIKTYMDEHSVDYQAAAEALGYDPNLVYSDENEGNILLFTYGWGEDREQIALEKGDSLFSFGFQALEVAWKTVLKDTLQLVDVNFSRESGHGSNFDKAYYKWVRDNKTSYTWVKDITDAAFANNYQFVQEWADAVYASYSADSAEQFLGWVEANVTYDRALVDGSTGKWSDIDPTTLTNKVRYSPLADYAFNVPTGALNLYFTFTGTKYIDNFFDTQYDNYSSLVDALNDALVAALRDLFPVSSNINGTYPTFATIGAGDDVDLAATEEGRRSLASTITGNAAALVQYVADSTDANILKAFYDNGGTTLTEANIEEAMVPMLIATVGQLEFGGRRVIDIIHKDDLDKAKDAEAVAYLALREYLSYVLPKNDYDGATYATWGEDEIEVSLDQLLLMARDAIVYVIEPYVPVTGSDGELWKAEDQSHTNDSIFTLLNSVVCYYADDYTMADGKGGRAMGVASLLGVCDTNGESLISYNANDADGLWNNIDLAVNNILPVLGELQYGTEGATFSSKDLLWNDVVQGVLEIGDTSLHTSGLGGVSNFLFRLITIVSAPIIRTDRVIDAAYDLVAELINNLFGARYSGQSFTTVIPVRSASQQNPWDDFAQISTIAGTSGTDIGALQKLICNLVEFFGYGTSGPSTYPDSMIRGVAFALTAVESFTGILPVIGEHQLKLATSTFSNEVIQGCTSGTSYSANLEIKNNSIGINTAYIDGMQNDQVVQNSRYYIKVTAISGPNGRSVTAPSTLVAPDETLTINAGNLSVYNPAAGNDYTSYSATITYDIVDENGNHFVDRDGNNLYTGLTTTCYQYLTGATSWQDVVYPEVRGWQFPEALESDSGAKTMTSNGYRTFTTAEVNKCVIGYPEYIVLGTDNLSNIENMRFRFRNNATSVFGSADRSIDGVYTYENKSVYDDAAGSNVSVNWKNAIPVFDPETGDLLRNEMYDYSTDNGVTWNRGDYDSSSKAYKGFTEQDVNAHSSEAGYVRRTHVAYTLDEARAAGIIAAAHINEAGICEYVYMKTGGGVNYDVTLSQVSARGPVNGFYSNFTKHTQAKNSSVYLNFMNYDGTTPVQAGQYDFNIMFYRSDDSNGVLNSGVSGRKMYLVVGDRNSVNDVNDVYNELESTLANYRASDFTSEEVYEQANAAMVEALAARATVLTPTSALELSDNTALTATTSTVATEYGDLAYEPATEDNWEDAGIPTSVYADATKDDVLYLDEDETMPIYTNIPLEDATVYSKVTDAETGEVRGTDYAGNAVIKGEDGVWHLRNAISYAREWDTETYDAPWYKSTGQQAENADGKLLFEQVQYVYRDAYGNKVNSDYTVTEDGVKVTGWKAKFPAATYACIENDGGDENRGRYTKAKDYLNYVIEFVRESIDPSIAQSLLDNVAMKRLDLNEVNFEIVTYNQMVKAGQNAEKQFTVNVTYTYPTYDEDGSPIMENDDYVRETITKEEISWNDYKAIMDDPLAVIVGEPSTNSTLSSAQVDEFKRLFDFYMDKVVERGYIGDQLEPEIAHSGFAYDALTVVSDPVYDAETGEVTADAVVRATGSGTPAYGALDASNNLVNEGDVVYSAATWSTYINALAAAVKVAQEGNGSYAHKNVAYYDMDAADTYTANVSSAYEADTAYQVAENRLTPAESVTLTVVGNGIDATVNGVAYTAPVGVEKGETVTVAFNVPSDKVLEYILVGDVKYYDTASVDVVMNDDTTVEVVVSSAGVDVSGGMYIATDKNATGGTVIPYGAFTINVYSDAARENLVATATSSGAVSGNTWTIPSLPAGTYYASVTSEYMLALDNVTIVVGDSAITGAKLYVVPMDFDGNTNLTADDATTVFKAAGKGTLKEYCDLDGSGTVTADDATIVFKFAGKGANLAAQTIQ